MTQVIFQRNPVTLIGEPIRVGDQAPDFTVLTNSLKPVTLDDYAGKTCLISVVPSLDTDICSLQTKRFNKEVSKLEDVQFITICMDLPFAQSRWCGTERIENIDVLSDHRNAIFGKNYGVLIEELRLLTRTVFVIDEQGIVTYVEYVSEVGEHPNYDAVLKHLELSY